MHCSRTATSFAAATLFIFVFWLTAPAAALDFNFSFQDAGITAYPLSGTISGLNDNQAGQMASSFVLTEMGGPHNFHESPPLPVDLLSDPTWSVTSNLFEVVGGSIVSANFQAMTLPPGSPDDSLVFTFNNGASFFQTYTAYFDGPLFMERIEFAAGAGAIFSLVTPPPTPSAVPEPTTLSLVVLGLAGVWGCCWRRRSRDRLGR